MSYGSIDSLENMNLTELVGLVRGLIGEVERVGRENEKLKAALAAAKRENQRLKDEIRRLKGLPPRPPTTPSGMEKATDRPAAEKPGATDGPPPRRRGPGVSKLSINRTVTLAASAPAGSRHKGYEEIIIQDIALKPEVTLYRRERWTTPDGRTVTADLPAGVVGGLRSEPASSGADAAFPGPNDLRADRGRADRSRPFDLEASGCAAPDRQTGPVPRRGGGRLHRRPSRLRLRQRRRHRRAPRRQGLLHNAVRLRPVHRVPHRAEQVPPRVPAQSARR